MSSCIDSSTPTTRYPALGTVARRPKTWCEFSQVSWASKESAISAEGKSQDQGQLQGKPLCRLGCTKPSQQSQTLLQQLPEVDQQQFASQQVSLRPLSLSLIPESLFWLREPLPDFSNTENWLPWESVQSKGQG